MKFFQKRGVAIVVLILAIVASSAWGLHKAPAITTPTGGEKVDTSLSTAAFEQYVRDEANVLSDKTEETIGLYNANWDKMFGSIMAVVTTESANDIENAAYDYAIEMQLAENDAILVIAKQQQDYYLLASGDFYDLLSGLSQSFVASCMADGVQKGDYDAAVRSLCAALHVELSQQYQQSEAALDEAANGVMFIMILIIFFVLWIMLDGMRYRRYRRRYMMPGMGVPTVMPRCKRAGVSGIPFPQLLNGQWHVFTLYFFSRSFSFSESRMQCAARKRSSSTPSFSRYSIGRTPKRCRKKLISFGYSFICACSRAPRSFA